MKVGFIGCVESSLMAIKTLLKMKDYGIEVVAVITKKQSSYNADYVNLSDVCEQYNIPCHFEDSKKKGESVKFMRSYQTDVIYCFGWSYLLANEFLTMAPKGAIGFHPAKLPQNRGRHPIIWTLALGLKVTASTFFRMEEGADTGPILSQIDIPVKPDDNAKDLYQNILDKAQLQIRQFTLDLVNDVAIYIEQEHGKATTWRKRSRKDGLIDWRMRAEDIYNLVRALSKPYPGAEFEYLGNLIPVWQSTICIEQFPINIEPGYILEIMNSSILVKSGGNTAIWLLSVEMSPLPRSGEYL